MTGKSEIDPVYAALRSTARFVWTNLPSAVVISLGWFLAALPIVTIGPATVGAYAAVLSLRDGDRLDYRTVLGTVRRQFVHATLVGSVPLILLGIAATYGLTYLRTAALVAGLLAIVTFNAAVYVWLVSIPTFVQLAGGATVAEAVPAGVRWSARHGVGVAVVGIVTVALFAVTSLLTVAVALLFAGVAFAFHVEFVAGVSDERTTLQTLHA